MLRFFGSRKHDRSVRTARRRPIGFEALEDRRCMSAVAIDAFQTAAVDQNLLGATALTSPMVTTADVNEAPTITNFQAQVTPFNLLVVQGIVNDEAPVGLPVTITFLGQQYTTTVQADGHFYWSLQLQPGQEGTLSCYVTDREGLQSETYQYLVMTPVPVPLPPPPPMGP